MDIIHINPGDNVAVALRDISSGKTVTADGISVTAKEAVSRGHKIALKDIKKDDNIIKYGVPIAHATADIAAGVASPEELFSMVSEQAGWAVEG